MTDEEIAKEDKDAFKNTKEGMKEQKWGFMQKYYHRGAFFQDVKEDGSGMAEPLYQRDVGAKTGWEDQFDRAALPAVKQKRNFGMAGQVKWTHLMDNDTTRGEGGSLGKSALRGHENQGTSHAEEPSRPASSEETQGRLGV